MSLDPTPYAVLAHHCAHIVNAHAGKATSSVLGDVVVGGCFLAIAAVSAWFLHKQHGGPDDSGGHGGSGGPPPEPPPEPPSPGEPTWWPEFEQEFAAYVAGEPENEKRPARIGLGASVDFSGKSSPDRRPEEPEVEDLDVREEDAEDVKGGETPPA